MRAERYRLSAAYRDVSGPNASGVTAFRRPIPNSGVFIRTMTNIAIIVGNATYKNATDLPCCLEDAIAIEALVRATGRYDVILKLSDVTGDALRDAMRDTIGDRANVGEILFYFSGHGFSSENDFYFCGTEFDRKRPNETGLSSSDLHTFLRAANPNLVVKIVDACHSGALLLKSDERYPPAPKGGFKNFIQISSCLDSQTSLAGEPLSEFTEKLCVAATRKEDGVIFYTDIENALRDEFIENDAQTPHFISQVTGREVFAEDAAALTEFRKQFEKDWRGAEAPALLPALQDGDEVGEPTLLDILKSSEAKIPSGEQMAAFIDALFSGVENEVRSSEFSDFFNISTVVHSDFYEDITQAFIIRVLSKEERFDKFVTATIKREKKKRGPFDIALKMSAMSGLYGDYDIVEQYDLILNCNMNKVQLRLNFEPKYSSLKKLSLVVTCAPSLERCYVFEMMTSHALTDWGSYDPEGDEVSKRWFKMSWKESTESVAGKIADKLHEVVTSHLDDVAERLQS